MRRSLLLLSFFLFSATAAQAQNVDPAQPFTLVKALQDLGYRAQLDADSVGDPRVKSQSDGTDYYIWFYGCTDNAMCTGLKWSAGFDLTNGMSLQKANEWNRDHLLGSVYLDDEDDPYIDYYVVAKGGLSAETFEETLSRWNGALSSFKDYIDW
jgi:hypothetical protein